ncbi:DUF1735 domain-containing protein [Pedobacter sp. UC225_61]|uniref:DUF1735 domain-containing protein n=1 Tax=Pedobacter sp. UC225_61 TaxID=3374623 RepID=UPI0037A17F63
MKHTILRCLSFALVGLTFFTSCRKDAFYNKDNEETNGGSTIIKVMGGKEPTVFLDALSGIKKVTIFSLRKDAGNADALNQATTVTLTYDAAVLAAYNTAHPTQSAAEILPDALFTIASNGITRTATGFEVKFAPGEFAKDFDINLNFDNFDFDKRFVFPFKITSNITTPNVVQSTLVMTVSVKNKWDGIYTVSGTMVDVTNPAFAHFSTSPTITSDAPYRLQLRTISATKCVIWDPKYFNGGGNFDPFYTGTGTSSFGSFDPIIEFDPATNKVIGITNFYGADVAATLRNARLDPTGVNQYTPSNKTLLIKYNLTQKAGLTPALASPFVRATWDEKWVYAGSR